MEEIYSFTKDFYFINAVHLNFIFIKETSEKYRFPQKYKKAQLMFLEQQISISEWFFQDRVKLKTGVMAAENSQYSQFTISQYYCFTVFLLNKCSLAERKRHFKKHFKKSYRC